MIVRRHEETARHELPGIEHRTLAGPRDGLRGLEVWLQHLAPGAETPWHRHACEEAVVVLRGSGVCESGGRRIGFGPDSTLIVPADAVHRIVNTGDVELVLLASLSSAPVVVETPDGVPMPLSWAG